MALTLLQRIVKRFNQTFSKFGEKTTVEIEDFELEHFLLYHGLIGNSPEGQRSFRDVRADFLAAVKDKSSLQMGIVLKLMPLFWEDKLKSIAAELKDTQRESLLRCLTPDNADGMLAPNQNPPFAEDWRIRANAATLIAFIGSPNSVKILTDSLNDTARSAKSAFCHTVLALSATKNPDALRSIEPYLFSEESWYRVDSINAIAHWPFEQVAEILADGLVSTNELSDYAAVATARNHKPHLFLTDKREKVQDAGAAMILSLCTPEHKAFTIDHILPFDLPASFDATMQLVKEKTSALRTLAALSLIEWIRENRLALSGPERVLPDQKQLDDSKDSLFSAENKQKLSAQFSQHEWKNNQADSVKDLEGMCLIRMMGEFKDSSQNEKLLELAHQHTTIYQNAAIDAIGKIGESSASGPLIAISKKLVNQEERATKAASAQPVVEENKAESITYWHILSALGNLKSEDSFNYLLGAIQDFAPDKREKALTSLVSASKGLTLSAEKQGQIREQLVNAFKDPSTLVRQSAIESSAVLADPALIEEVVAMMSAKESSSWKEAHRALKSMAQQGHKDKVLVELNKRASATSDSQKSDRIQKLINELR